MGQLVEGKPALTPWGLKRYQQSGQTHFFPRLRSGFRAADGRTRQHATVLYLANGPQPFAVMNGAAVSWGYVSLPGSGFAIYNSSGVMRYNHPDWLGSARLITIPSRSLGGDQAYAPYGEVYALTGRGWTQFTSGGNVWTAGGNDDFLYRRYSPTQSR